MVITRVALFLSPLFFIPKNQPQEQNNQNEEAAAPPIFRRKTNILQLENTIFG